MTDRVRAAVRRLVLPGAVLALAIACASPASRSMQAGLAAGTEQLVVVTTPGWDSITGELRRFVRQGPGSPWRSEGGAVPVVVGRTGLAWGIGYEYLAAAGAAGEGPRKREGDGRSPAGVFPLGPAFGFPPGDSMPWVRLPYLALTAGTDCVDDTASVHYNTVVERGAVPRVDWRSAEHMRQIEQYRLGVIIEYNATPPVKGRGSCIFFHVWGSPRTATAGCTALAERDLRALVAWLDPRARPMLVQVPDAGYPQLRAQWGLPVLGPS